MIHTMQNSLEDAARANWQVGLSRQQIVQVTIIDGLAACMDLEQIAEEILQNLDSATQLAKSGKVPSRAIDL